MNICVIARRNAFQRRRSNLFIDKKIASSRPKASGLAMTLIGVFFLLNYVQAFAAEVPHYTIQATIDAEHKNIAASETVQFTNPTAKPLKELFFHIYPNRRFTDEEKNFILRYGSYFKVNPYPQGFQSANFSIHSLVSGAEPLTFSLEGEDLTLLKISLPRELAPAQSIEIKIDFSTDIPHAYGRFGFHENIFALSRWYPILSVVDENGWNKAPFYPFHRPFFSEAAKYSVQLTVPSEEVVIHTGELKEVQNKISKNLSFPNAFPSYRGLPLVVIGNPVHQLDARQIHSGMT